MDEQATSVSVTQLLRTLTSDLSISQAYACGAEALSRRNENMADGKGWVLAKNFKLRLHPSEVVERNNLKLDGTLGRTLATSLPSYASVLALPSDVSLENIYTDFLTYVLKHTKQHLKADTGSDPWTPDAEIIIAHPNKWGKTQQDFLMQVAVASGFVEDSDYGRSRIYFVEEAEASARYCVSTSSTPFASLLNVRGLYPRFTN